MSNSRNPSVMIGIPSGSDWKADFGLSFAGLAAAGGRPLKGGGQIERLVFWNAKGSILPRSRTSIVKGALEADVTHLLFLDSDMTFPSFTLHALLAADKDIVAANCVTKVIPALATARQKGETKAGEEVDSRQSKGLEKVWRVGTGVMLVKMKVFRKIPQPWFPITWNEENQDYTGEDWNFIQAAQAAGIPAYIDHDLSKHIGHIGSYTFTMHDMA